MELRTLAAAAPIAALLKLGAAQAAPTIFYDEAEFLAAAASAGIFLGFESFETYEDFAEPPIVGPIYTIDGFLFVLNDDSGSADFATDGKKTLVSNASNQPRFTFNGPVNAFAIDVIDVLTGPATGTFGLSIDGGASITVLEGAQQPFFHVEFIGILDLDEGFTEIVLNTGQIFEAFNLDRFRYGALLRGNPEPVPTPTPEPASLALLLGALGATAWLRRRS